MDYEIIVQTIGTLVYLTALFSSPEANQLLLSMACGSYVSGSRIVTGDDLEQAFILIDANNLRTLTLG